jgi:hypothetical protein
MLDCHVCSQKLMCMDISPRHHHTGETSKLHNVKCNLEASTQHVAHTHHERMNMN